MTTNFTKIKKIKMQEKPLHIKKFFIWLSYSIVGFFVFGFLFSCAPTKTTPKAVNGVLDIRDWDFKQDGILKLDGEWEFYWEKYCKSEEYIPTPNETGLTNCSPEDMSGYIQVPSDWKTFQNNGKEIGSSGYSTYKLKIQLKVCILIFCL